MILGSPMVHSSEITSRLQKGGALIDDMRQLVLNWTNKSSEDSPLRVSARILQKSTRARAADTYRRAFLPRFINGRPPDAWRLAKQLEAAAPSIEIVRPFYYWITARAEPLLYRFVTENLFEKAKSSDIDIRIEETVSWIRKTLANEGKRWSPTVQLKVARGVLAALRDFGILEGATRKRIAPLHLSLEAFCLIAFCLSRFVSEHHSLIEHPDWRLFLLTESGVERMLLESHQHGWLHYQAAGRVRRVEFPAEDFGEYVRVVLRAKP
jgi:Putative inner membrane protein (DUF1819)